MDNVKMVDINEVKPYFRNTKIHTSMQARRIAGSIADFGWDQPIVVDSEMVIIKGHGRLQAAQHLGMKEVPVLIRNDMSIEAIQASRIADNKTAESEWDADALWKEIKELEEVGIDSSSLGFDIRSLRRIFPEEDEFQKTGGVGTDTGKKEEEQVSPAGMCSDLTKPEKETFIAYHKGEDAYLRRLSMADYLDSHDKILVGFSSGKDSVDGDTSFMWFKIDDVPIYCTPSELLDNHITIKSEVIKPNGQVIIEPMEVVETQTVSSIHQKEGKVIFKPVNYIMYHDYSKPLYRVKCKTGRFVDVTGDHSLMESVVGSSGQYMKESKASELSVGRYVPVVEKAELHITDNPKYEDWFLRFAGLWIADGCYAVRRKIIISTGNDPRVCEFLRTIPRIKTKEEQIADVLVSEIGKHQNQEACVSSLMERFGVSRSCVLNVIYKGINPISPGGKEKTQYIQPSFNENGDVWLHSKALYERMTECGFIGTSHTKKIPEWVFYLSDRQIGLFLAGYFDGDGCLSKGKVTTSSVSIELSDGVRVLLSRLGIKNGRSVNSFSGGYHVGSTNYIINIGSVEGRNTFKEKVPTFKVMPNIDGKAQSVYDWRSACITSIELLEEDTVRVFDFEVADTHMFIANGIVVHNSMAALVWILENCDKSKVIPYYTNPGWGVDWPHSLAFVKIFEKMVGIKILMAGVCDPGAPGKWEDCVQQHAFPGYSHGCWIESLIKIPQATALLRQEDLIAREGLSVVQILAIRHAESPNRAKTYPDRGVLKDTGNHFASPIISWSDGDVGKYLDDRGIFLHTAYEGESRMGCLMCPKGSPTGSITIRKKYPDHWAKICQWYAMGSRKRKGQIAQTIQKWMTSLEDLPPQKVKKISGAFSAIALSTPDLEDKYEEALGEKIQRPFFTQVYNPGVTEMPNDLKESGGR